MKWEILPKCKNGWPQYISSQGQWFPCWFVSHAHRFWETDFFVVNAEKFNLNNRNIEDILAEEVLIELENCWKSGEDEKIPFKCKQFCGKKLNSLD